MPSILRRIARRLRHGPATDADGLPRPSVTLHTLCRIEYQSRLLARVRDIPGDIVECGVGKGETLLYWAGLAYDEGKNRRVWGFDSFEGFPEPAPQDASPRNPKRGEWKVSDIPAIIHLLERSGFAAEWIRSRVTLVKGFFEESLRKYTGDAIALLHIDVDLYDSYKTVLTQLYPRVRAGGVVCFDEYMGTLEHYRFPGAVTAIDEFFAPLGVPVQREPNFGKYFVVKPANGEQGSVSSAR